MSKYNPKLLTKTEIVLLTKSDLIDKKIVAKDIKSLKSKSKKVMAVSIHDWGSLEKLKKIIVKTPKQ
jgi:GTPase involved in cell partitioning and DNA repair